jgi:hypothetical protein
VKIARDAKVVVEKMSVLEKNHLICRRPWQRGKDAANGSFTHPNSGADEDRPHAQRL